MWISGDVLNSASVTPVRASKKVPSGTITALVSPAPFCSFDAGAWGVYLNTSVWGA